MVMIAKLKVILYYVGNNHNMRLKVGVDFKLLSISFRDLLDRVCGDYY